MPRRRSRKKNEHRQYVMRFLPEDYPIQVQCCICLVSFPSVGELLEHVVGAHSSYCTRCKSVHSGDCKPPSPNPSYRFQITDEGVRWETDEDMKRRVETEAQS